MDPEATEEDVVLLVDDDASNLAVLRETLKSRPALVLLDIMMPGIDGFEACRRLKSTPETADAAVIFLSALDDAKDKVRGLELGAVDFISKPFDPQEVIARVETHLKIRRLERTLVRNNRILEETNEGMRTALGSAARVQQSFLPHALPVSKLRRKLCSATECPRSSTPTKEPSSPQRPSSTC